MRDKLKPIIIIAGPTGTGKSNVAIQLAKLLATEIISADSVQVYKGFDIGSGKVTHQEMDGIKHHLIDCSEADRQFSVEEFQKKSSQIIEKLLEENKFPIVCGGTSLYIHSLLYNLDFSKEKRDPNLRTQLEIIYEKKGAEKLFSILKQLDPDKARTIDPHNHRRLIRAIEIAKSGKKVTYDKFRERNTKWDFKYFVLIRERQALYDRINKRVLKMRENGLITEVESLYKKYGERAPGLKTIGYKEIVSYLNKELSLEQAIEKVQQHSRNLAKRQLTWYRREENTIPIYIDEHSTAKEVSKIIFEKIMKQE